MCNYCNISYCDVINLVVCIELGDSLSLPGVGALHLLRTYWLTFVVVRDWYPVGWRKHSWYVMSQS